MLKRAFHNNLFILAQKCYRQEKLEGIIYFIQAIFSTKYHLNPSNQILLKLDQMWCFMFVYANYNLIQKYVLNSHKKLYYMTVIFTILYYDWMKKYKKYYKYLHPIWHIITF